MNKARARIRWMVAVVLLFCVGPGLPAQALETDSEAAESQAVLSRPAEARPGDGTPLAGAERGNVIAFQTRQQPGKTIHGTLMQLADTTFAVERRGLFGHRRVESFAYADVQTARFAAPVYHAGSDERGNVIIIAVVLVVVVALVVFAVLLARSRAAPLAV